MRSLRAALAASLAAVALLAGCTDDDPSPGDATSTWTPTGTPETPTPSATAKPTEPALPDAATKATEAGARAFITYYWDLINYAQVTGDVKALKRVSARGCAGCLAGYEAIRRLYAGGGHIAGGEYEVAVTKLNELDGPASSYLFEGLLRADNNAQTVHKPDGTVHRSRAGSINVAVATSWTDEAWRMEVMDPR